MSKDNIGKCLLSNLLRQRRMTQADLAYLTGINKHQLSNYMNDKNVMSLKTARIISKSLKCKIDDLYDWIV